MTDTALNTIRGRKVATAGIGGGKLTIVFTDGSKLYVTGANMRVEHDTTHACERCGGTGWVFREDWGDEPCGCNPPTYSRPRPQSGRW